MFTSLSLTVGAIFLQAQSQRWSTQSMQLSSGASLLFVRLCLFGNIRAPNECACADMGGEVQLRLCLCRLAVQFWCSFWHEIVFAIKPDQNTSYHRRSAIFVASVGWGARTQTKKIHKTPSVMKSFAPVSLLHFFFHLLQIDTRIKTQFYF